MGKFRALGLRRLLGLGLRGLILSILWVLTGSRGRVQALDIGLSGFRVSGFRGLGFRGLGDSQVVFRENLRNPTVKSRKLEDQHDSWILHKSTWRVFRGLSNWLF